MQSLRVLEQKILRTTLFCIAPPFKATLTGQNCTGYLMKITSFVVINIKWYVYFIIDNNYNKNEIFKRN